MGRVNVYNELCKANVRIEVTWCYKSQRDTDYFHLVGFRSNGSSRIMRNHIMAQDYRYNGERRKRNERINITY